MRRNPESSHPLVALLLFGVGAFVLLVALDVIPAEPGSIRAPRWVLGLCGVVLGAGGMAIAGPRFAMLRSLGLSVLLFAFAGVAGWVALLASANGFDVGGGIPFVSRSVNVAVARGLAGLGALLCLGLLVYGWKTGFRSRTEAASPRDRSDP